ncbi:MAG TPA: hypothetical protein PLC53_01725 [Bacilli bacterium]|nr:hypothetical protein [Bacilli bacterium]
MKNKLLIIFISLIILVVGGLGYYIFFVYDKEENVLTDRELTTTEISNILDGFPYQNLLNLTDRTVSDLTEEEILYIGYYGLTDDEIVTASIDNCDYADKSEKAKCIVTSLGLKESKIDAMDTSLWESILTENNTYGMFSKDSIDEVILNRLGLTNQYNNSFVDFLDLDTIALGLLYDNNIDMFFQKIEENNVDNTDECLSCSTGCSNEIITYLSTPESGYIKDNEVIITVVKGMFVLCETDEDTYYNLYAESNPETLVFGNIDSDIYSTEDINDYLLSYSDQLDSYKITFKKVDDTYQFVSIEYLD